MSNRKYFGTDGIRGKVGETPITPDFVLKLGYAAGRVLSKQGIGNTVIVGKDPRISGYMLESAIEAGFAAAGLKVALTGPMPTPAIAYLTKTFRCVAGVVISASHNPFYDNGIKFFSKDGMKLSDEIELEIERELEQPVSCVESQFLGKAFRIDDARGRYIEYCKSNFPNDLSLNGLKIVVDCANGATYHIAPSVLQELGANVIKIGCEPDGLNINLNCGATDIKALQARVVAEKADVGFALDGDGDRIIMVDHFGNKVDGDQIIYIIAKYLHEKEKMIGGVVGTLMSNMSLQHALAKLNIPFERSAVGDRYVLEKLQALNWRLGAENSGHVLLLDHTSTGDGIIAGLQVLAAMIEAKTSLHELCKDIQLFPQIMINVRFSGQHNPLESEKVKRAVQDIETKLADSGRVLLRKSGTEPLIRVMVEGQNAAQIKDCAAYLAKCVEDA